MIAAEMRIRDKIAKISLGTTKLMLKNYFGFDVQVKFEGKKISHFEKNGRPIHWETIQGVFASREARKNSRDELLKRVRKEGELLTKIRKELIKKYLNK